MAKKTIISDFSALKGKLSFSEKSSYVKVTPKVSEKGLKVGQSVVLMDSNLRGKIIGLGRDCQSQGSKGQGQEYEYET